MKKSTSNKKPWHWPFQRYSDGPEYECPHGVGHSVGVHGCDGITVNGRLVGCCSDPNFPGNKIKKDHPITDCLPNCFDESKAFTYTPKKKKRRTK